MNKKTWILAGLFVLFTLIAYFSLSDFKQTSDVPENPITDAGMIDQIDLKDRFKDMTLTLIDTTWWITRPFKFKASRPYTDRFLSQLVDFKIDNIISTNASKHSKFKVDTSGVLMTLRSGGEPIFELIFGQRKPDFRFCRIPSSDNVYTSTSEISFVNESPESWRDKTILGYDLSMVRKIRITHQGDNLEIEFQNGKWLVGGRSGLVLDPDQEVVGSMVLRLGNFTASAIEDDFEDGKAEEKPVVLIEAELATGTEKLTFFPGIENENQYFVKKEGSSVVYSTYKATLGSFLKKAEDFGAPMGSGGPK